MAETDGEDELPFDGVGGEERVRELAARFYDRMDADEPALARLHQVDELGRVSKGSRERFATFLVEWLGRVAAVHDARDG